MEVELTFAKGDVSESVHLQANRTLARDMLGFIRDQLRVRGLGYGDVEGVGVFRGPGSFTGLRIGMAVLNTWARAERIPIVGAVGDDWKETCLTRLHAGDDDEIILPEYGAPAHTTKPRK